jgi:hypothetical protein
MTHETGRLEVLSVNNTAAEMAINRQEYSPQSFGLLGG